MCSRPSPLSARICASWPREALESDIHLWELETGREIRTLRGQTGWFLDGTFSPDGRKFAGAGWQDKTARIWDVQDGKLLGSTAASQRR